MLPAPLSGEYTAVRALGGGGGEADLFVGRDARHEDRVVKLYRRGIRADRQVWDRLGDLAHPSLMRIERTGTADGRDFEVMPYLRGGTAAARMPMRTGDLVHVVRRLVGGVNQLHALGIVHRDIKPANMLFVDAGPQVVLADYGISRLLERARMTVAFTPGFAPPEHEVTPAYDWWSLGMSVLLLAAGADPFHGMTAPAVQQRLRESDMDLSRVPSLLRPLCRGLLQRDPDARWGSARVLDWADAYDRPTAPGIPPAPPPPAPTRREPPPAAPAGPAKTTAPAKTTTPAKTTAPAKTATPAKAAGPAKTAAPAKALPGKAVASAKAPAPAKTAGPAKTAASPKAAGPAKTTPPAKAPAPVRSAASTAPPGADGKGGHTLRYGSGTYTGAPGEPARLAQALRDDPQHALAALLPAGGGSPDLDALLGWQPLRAGRTPQERAALEAELRGSRSRWYKLNRLLLGLDPAGLPVLADRPLSQAALEGVCLEAADGNARAIEAVRELREEELLALLARFDRLKALGAAAAPWRRLVHQWTNDTVMANTPATVRFPRNEAVPPLLLLAALPGTTARRKLEVRAAAVTVPAQVEPWYQKLLDRMGGEKSSPGLVVRAVCAPLAAKQTPPPPKTAPKQPAKSPVKQPAQPPAKQPTQPAAKQPAKPPAKQPTQQETRRQETHRRDLEALRAGSRLTFGGHEYSTAAQLATTIRHDRKAVIQGFLVDWKGTTSKKELAFSWELLREWSARLARVADAQRPNWDAGFDGEFRLTDQPELAVLRLLRFLDPQGTPVLCGRPVAGPELIEACAAVVNGAAGASHQDRKHVLEVLKPGVLETLARFPSLAGSLYGVQAGLRKLENRYASYPEMKKLRQVASDQVFRIPGRAAMLLAAIGEPAADRLRTLAERTALAKDPEVTGLVAHMGGPDSPGGLAMRAVYTRRAVRAYQYWQEESRQWQLDGGPRSGRPKPVKPPLPPPDSLLIRARLGLRALTKVEDE
ncbi:protein kinase [Streptomyces sp. NPDC014656]|uniref:serine/threonine protein kinase n=1 Tax=Streptomyces sp. NPDC014656 TaxID=3364878 RepID=UPI0036F65C6B